MSYKGNGEREKYKEEGDEEVNERKDRKKNHKN